MKTHIICILIAIVVFIFDINLPLGVAGGVPYIAVVLAAMYADDKKVIIIFAVVCSLLTVLGYYTSPVGGEHWKVLLNRGLALFAILVGAVLAFRWKAANDKLAITMKSLVDNNNELKMLSMLISQVPTAIFITDKEGNIEYTNSAFNEITGFTPEEAIGKNPRILNSGKNDPSIYKEIWSTILDRKIWKGSLINSNKDGSDIHVNSLIMPITDDKGEIYHFASIGQDVSDVFTAQSKLQESEGKFKQLVESAPVCIHEIDLEGKLLSMNKAGLDMMGVSSEDEIKGMDYFSIPCKEDQRRIRNLFEKALSGTASKFDFSVSSEKNILYFSSSFVPVKTPEGEIIKVMGVSQNVTKQKIAELQIKEALKVAEDSGKVKEEFLSIISHELRTPMNGILGATELIKSFPEETKNSLEILEESGQRMSDTIENILSFIDTTKESWEITTSSFSLEDLQKFLEDKILINQKFSSNENVEILWNGWSGELTNDANIIQKIIWNILSNSLKFTKEGKIEINASLNEQDNKLTIDIIDTGCGISKNHRERIFDHFTQIDSSIRRNAEGLGLGLALTKKLTLLVGAKIELVSSEENTGSHFRLII